MNQKQLNKKIAEWCEKNITCVRCEDRLIDPEISRSANVQGEPGLIAACLQDIFDEIKRKELYTITKTDGVLTVVVALLDPNKKMVSVAPGGVNDKE